MCPAQTEIKHAPCSPAMLAGTILDAWLCGDRLRLTAELDRTLRLSPSESRDVESDQMEILKTIAGRMRCGTNLFVPRSSNPRIGLWVDLLQHISRPQ